MSGHTICGSLILDGHPSEAMGDSDCNRRVADWYGEWQRPLRRFIAQRRAIPSRDLEDVAQEVFVRLMRYNRAELIEQPQAYLFKMAANVAVEWAIRSRNASAREMTWLADNERGDSSEEDMSRLAAEEQIARALLTLCPRQREVLKLQFFEGLSRAQTAERLGVTERAVKRALAKSYQRLRRELAPPRP